jgi:RNA recognition motif-containing protein
MLDKITGQPRGFGFVIFSEESAAERVIESYD